MTKVAQNEVLIIARVSHIDIHQDELEPMTTELEAVLTYAVRVKEIKGTQEPLAKNSNVFRHDIVAACDAEELLSRAPERQGDYFAVPIILDSSVQ